MKTILFGTLFCTVLLSCTDNTTEKAPAADSTQTTLAYSMPNPQWMPGSSANTQAAMAALKAFENNNIEECVSYMNDSVRFEFNEFEMSMTKDSAKALLQRDRNMYKTITVKMEDYESVKNDKSEYVSLWYKQITEMKDGKIDSAEVMNDIRMKNGKISMINEKTRKYMVRK